MFRGIASDDFPPFGKFELDLPPAEGNPDLAEVHLFTGVNGTGKTRLLAVLAAMLGNPEPLKERVCSESRYLVRASDQPFPVHPAEQLTLRVERSNTSLSQRAQRLLDKSRLIPAFAYSGMAYLRNTTIRAVADAPKPKRESCLAFGRLGKDSQLLLQAISNLKMQAGVELLDRELDVHRGESVPVRSHERRIVEAIEGTVSKVTGRPFAFRITTYPSASIEVIWGKTQMSIDHLPDGLRSIIGWMVDAVVMMDAWLQGKSTPMESEAVFLLDEIESHLHPAWQRRILPAFQRLFPKAQIFVATHSPFIIASLNHGWIHPLTLGEDGRVTVEQPVKASAGDSYVSVLEDIMGLKEWYDPETEQLLAEFRAQRDAAYRGGDEARNEALRLAEQIGGRSMELHYMMGREVAQMERQLAQTPAEA